MKKILFMIIISLASAGAALALSWGLLSTPSGQRNADALIHTGPAAITSFIITTNGSADATLTIYNNTTATGTPVFTPIVVNGADYYGGVVFEDPVYCGTGIYADIEGTGAMYSINYKKLE